MKIWGQSFYQSYQTYTKPTKTIRFGMHSPFTKPYTIQRLYSIVLLPNLTQFCDCTIKSVPNLLRYEFLLSILDFFFNFFEFSLLFFKSYNPFLLFSMYVSYSWCIFRKNGTNSPKSNSNCNGSVLKSPSAMTDHNCQIWE